MKIETNMFPAKDKPSNPSPSKHEQLKVDFRKYSIIMLAVLSSFFASIQEGKAQPKAGAFPKPESTVGIENEFIKQKEFLVNWYKNRVIQDNKFNEQFNEDKDIFLQRLEEVTVSATSGSDGWKNDTIFINPSAFKFPGNKTSMTHNLAHDALQANYSEENEEFKSSMPDWMREMILKAIKRAGDERFEPAPELKESYQTPEEVYARICALRQRCGLPPDQPISRKYLKKILIENNHDENTYALFLTFPNVGALLDLVNNLP